MKKEMKVVKIDQDEILSIISEYFNFSKKIFVKKGVKDTLTNIYGTVDKDLRAVCVLSSGHFGYEEIDINEVEKKYDFTDGLAVDYKE